MWLPRLRLRIVRLPLIIVALQVLAWAKAPPDWLKPVLAEDIAELGRGKVAVRLLDSTQVRHLPDNRIKRVRRGAVRVLTDQGRQRATCSYPFNADMERVVAAKAWIVSPDGKNAREFGIRDFADAAVKIGNIFWPQLRELGYRGTTEIPIGSVFAWEFEAESQTGISDINWSFPTDLATLLSEIEVVPSAGGKLDWHLSGGPSEALVVREGSVPAAMRWEKRRYVPTTGGDAPAGFLVATQMLSIRNVPSGGAAVLQSWMDLARLAAGVIEPRMSVTPEIQAKADAVVAGKSTRWERVRALSEFVQKEISYLALVLDHDFLAGYRPHFAGEVLTNRYGDCKDKVALFITLLRAVGETGHVVLVASGNPMAVDPAWPSARFNHVIAALPADDTVPQSWPFVNHVELGKLILFDPTDPNTPLGVLAGVDQGGFGLVASEKAGELIRLPMADPTTNRLETVVRARLDADGDLVANVDEVSFGGLGILLHASRDNLRNDRFTAVLEGRLRENLSFVEALQWKDAWQAPEARWKLEFDFKAPRYARRTGGDLMLVGPSILLGKMRLAPWTSRQDGVVWTAASLQKRRVTLTFPELAQIEEVPDDWHQSIKNAECRIHYKREANDVIYECEIRQDAGFMDKRTYEALRVFLQKVYDAERRPVLVRRAAVTATAK